MISCWEYLCKKTSPFNLQSFIYCKVREWCSELPYVFTWVNLLLLLSHICSVYAYLYDICYIIYFIYLFFAEPCESNLQRSWWWQRVFPENIECISIWTHHLGDFTLIHGYYLLHCPYSHFSTCPKSGLSSNCFSAPGSHIAFRHHVVLASVNGQLSLDFLFYFLTWTFFSFSWTFFKVYWLLIL